MNNALETWQQHLPGGSDSGDVVDASKALPWPRLTGVLEDTVGLVAVGSLLPGDSPRVAGESDEYVLMLAELEVALPPVIVHKETGRIIDGRHRVRAAALRGQEFVKACFFEGSQEDAFVLSVRLNLRHGLPLTDADRTASAERITASHPQWSNRRIAEATGLAPKTIAAIRRRSTGDWSQLTSRTGRDGRVRPLNPAEGRLLASRLMTDDPTASLREVADAAGIAVATARDVRQRMLRSQDVLPPRLRQGRPQTPAEVPEQPPDQPPDEPAEPADQQPEVPQQNPRTLESLRRDPSLRHSDSGRQLLQLLSVHLDRPDQWDWFANSVPPHRAGAVALMARACARQWLEFARTVDTPGERGGSPEPG